MSTITNLCVVVILACLSTVSSQFQGNEGVKDMPAVDFLIASLQHEQWEADDEPCLRSTLDMLWGVKNSTLWATWIWDSMQPPTGSFYGVRLHTGNYDQCLQTPWTTHPSFRTQYCLVDVNIKYIDQTKELSPLDKVEEYFQRPSKYSRKFNEQVFGVCLPAICRPSTVARIFRHMHQLSHLPHGVVSVDPRDCQKSGEAVHYSEGFYWFWMIVLGFFTVAVVSTILAQKKFTSNRYLDKIISSFCIRRNYNGLFKVNKDDIKVITVLRLITAILVVAVHLVFFTLLIPNIGNGLVVEDILNSHIGKMLNQIVVLVETFFVMSGLLLIRRLLTKPKENLIYSLVKRYIRIIGPLALSTLYISTHACTHLGQGPFWSRLLRLELDTCDDNWWRNFLMVNSDAKTLCHIVTWYITSDFQLTVLGTFIYYLYWKNKKLGVTAFALTAVGFTLYLGSIVYIYKYDVVTSVLRLIFDLREYPEINYIYVKSYTRVGPYFVGMAMGYVFATYDPSRNRNVINKRNSIILFMVSLLTLGGVLGIGSVLVGRPYNPLVAAVVVSTNRVIWALAICGIIAAFEYGSLPKLSEEMWPGIVPLSKLSYCVYMVHVFVISKVVLTERSTIYFSLLTQLLKVPGLLILILVFSLLIYLILEAPIVNLTIDTRPKLPEQNALKKEGQRNDKTYQKDDHVKSKIL